ncbi:MAG TPA: hypothetical protein VFB12_08135 [Ktedonobacteraceae bacterium]|nr:hypothetical protein [Ktedonobacteraceae bacterium]
MRQRCQPVLHGFLGDLMDEVQVTLLQQILLHMTERYLMPFPRDAQRDDSKLTLIASK